MLPLELILRMIQFTTFVVLESSVYVSLGSFVCDVHTKLEGFFINYK